MEVKTMSKIKLVAQAAATRGLDPKGGLMSQLMRVAIPVTMAFLFALLAPAKPVWAEINACNKFSGLSLSVCNKCEAKGSKFNSAAKPMNVDNACPNDVVAAVPAPAPKPEKKVASNATKPAPKPEKKKETVVAAAPVATCDPVSQITGADGKCVCNANDGYTLLGGQCVNSLECPAAFTIMVGENFFTCGEALAKIKEEQKSGFPWWGWLLIALALGMGGASFFFLLVDKAKRDRLDKAQAKVEQAKKDLMALEGKLEHANRFLENHPDLVEQIKKVRSRFTTLVGMDDVPEEALTKAKNEVESIESANKGVVDQLAIQKAMPEKIKAAKVALKTAEAELAALITGKPTPAAPAAKKDEGPTKA
jgi:hypothetical protein